MTAIMPERPITGLTVDLDQLRIDIIKVLCRHGLADLQTFDVTVQPITQGGFVAGVSLSGMAYERPAALPPLPPRDVEAERRSEMEAFEKLLASLDREGDA